MISQNRRMLQLRRLVKRPPTPLEEALAKSIADDIERNILAEIKAGFKLTESEEDDG